MEITWVGLILLAVAGFLVGGVYSLWKTTKLFAVVLGICAAVAAGAGVVWLVG